MTTEDRIKLRRVVIDRLDSWQQAGVLQVPKAAARIASGDIPNHPSEFIEPRKTQREAESRPALPTEKAEPEITQSTKELTPAMAKKSGWQAEKTTSLFESPKAAANSPAGMTLEILQQQVAGCTRCNELASTRTQTVFGVGDPHARLCFLGEAPGADEDKTGIPFVGRGGQLLTKIIEACKLKRDDVYILNMIKCRPPGNRNPLPHELSNCRGYLESQLDLIRPEFICCLGAVASQNLLQTTISIGKLRGKVHLFRGVKVVCTYHPAFLLRSPSFKKEAWEDMKLLMREMGVDL
ncbi:MAG TPA: uracil-DNA glycosylase [Lacipirellulaceae bacterium]|nr:uracil-DNA glycosylase [Lacipirellulaceae bacterium]